MGVRKVTIRFCISRVPGVSGGCFPTTSRRAQPFVTWRKDRTWGLVLSRLADLARSQSGYDPGPGAAVLNAPTSSLRNTPRSLAFDSEASLWQTLGLALAERVSGVLGYLAVRADFHLAPDGGFDDSGVGLAAYLDQVSGFGGAHEGTEVSVTQAALGEF